MPENNFKNKKLYKMLKTENLWMLNAAYKGNPNKDKAQSPQNPRESQSYQTDSKVFSPLVWQTLSHFTD